MLSDILTFASRTLVTNGRLSMWMPTVNDEVELLVPMHPNLELVSISVQHFNNCRCLSPYYYRGTGLSSWCSDYSLTCAQGLVV